jgi:antitoxin component YwqK of YwqJK toxin-antitoxin module
MKNMEISIYYANRWNLVATLLLGALSIFISSSEAKERSQSPVAQAQPKAIAGRSLIPSPCSTMKFCVPERAPGHELNGNQSCVNYDKRDVKVMVSSWKNDLLEGYFWCASDDGTPQIEANYSHGELHGKYREYDSRLKDWALEQEFKNGMRFGISRKKLSKDDFIVSQYINGQRQGYELLVDAKNQIKQVRDCMILGRRAEIPECENIPISGYEKAYAMFTATANMTNEAENNRPVETHYADGKIFRRYTLVNGLIDGKHTSYFENGRPSAIALYSKGKVVEKSLYFEEGQLKQVTLFDRSLEKKQTVYYQNGKPQSERQIIESQNSGLKYAFKEYFDNGQLAQSGVRLSHHTDGTFDGEIRSYFKTGELAALSIYDNGTRVGTWKYTHDNLYLEDSYKNGKLETRVIYDKVTKKEIKRSEFMPDGSLKSEKIFSSSKI